MSSSFYNSFSNFSSTTTTPNAQTTFTTSNSTLSDKMEYEKINENDNNNEISSNSSLLQIQKLNEIEKKIGTLLKVASQAISVLSGDVDDNIKNNFEELSIQYLELVNDIQLGLRETFRFLTNTDIESTSYTANLPYISNTYGEEKDHEISVKVLELVKTKINSILNSMGGSTIPLPISLSSSSIASGTPNHLMPAGLNHKFLNSRFTTNAELIASSLCSSNNNSNANIKMDDELANDIAISKKQKIKKEVEDLMEVEKDTRDNKVIEQDINEQVNPTIDDITLNSENKKETVKPSDFITNNYLNIENNNNTSSDKPEIQDLDLDF
ncbi:hypothetical protein BCR32DRAFT_267540 [Anaeromyces robustus]|uniref:Mediator of RNA polymerase II transcription subunit 11 n=1 Tax=Anaeromyces robustus TaxID=1754192 RepID=A0A1Y1XA52_9FUNG|nr:hypothetical protein BCR32DRAFT_267540 [Anaeromyces robustus]|eukprot:ORX82609.1 hypothetical protein BCR32DRAFT_267540 [Anaeromyces robustus]